MVSMIPGVLQDPQERDEISGFGEKYLKESIILPKFTYSSHKVI